MYSSEYYVPSHITGFFVPYFNDDILKTGSTGAGVSLSKGLKTKITVKNGSGSVGVTLNGTSVKNYMVPVTINCITLIKDRYSSYLKNKDIQIEHISDVPVEAGFGTSASAALGICFSIRDLISITKEECIKIAHETEVKSLSGLGDVVAEVTGGIEIRKTPGVSGLIDNIPFSKNLEVMAISLGKKKTENILKDTSKLKFIERYGTKLLDKLIKELTVEKLMECSREFTYKTGIMSSEVLDIIEIISEKNTYNAAGIMIGEGVFTFIEDNEKSKIINSLKDIKGEIIISPIAQGLI